MDGISIIASNMSGYTKLFSSIVTSSIWSEDDKTRIVWVTMLALADEHGLVEAALPGLANAARVSVEDCQKSIDKFLAPDGYSRSTEFEGRRIERVEGGWKLLNHSMYRAKFSEEERKAYKAMHQALYRARRRGLPLAGETEFLAALKAGDQEAADRVLEKYLPK